MRRLALLLTGLAILAGINLNVWRYEQALGSGEMVLLRLAPVDPRSLMQGDYMRLAYDITNNTEITRQPGNLADARQPATDTLVIRLDKHRVAHRVAAGNPEALAQDERLLQVRRQNGRWWAGPDAFFFEEGQGAQFAAARYGEFRLQEDGKTLLVGLRDGEFKPLGQRRSRW